MFTNAVSIEVAVSDDDGFFIISATYPDGTTVGWVRLAIKEGPSWTAPSDAATA